MKTTLFSLLFASLLLSPGCVEQAGGHDDDDDDGGGVPVIAWQDLGPGEVVVIADSSMFGYYLDVADNTAFVLNFAAF